MTEIKFYSLLYFGHCIYTVLRSGTIYVQCPPYQGVASLGEVMRVENVGFSTNVADMLATSSCKKLLEMLWE